MPLPMLIAIDSISHWISICSRATPFYQSALSDHLEYEFVFNDNNRMILATGDTDASYDIENISLEYDMVTQPELTLMISSQYSARIAILYDRILCHCNIRKDQSDTIWNINLIVPARSMKGIPTLFEEVAAQQPFARDTEAFYNPKITKLEVTIEGIPYQLFGQGMCAYQMWDETKKFFAAGSKRHPARSRKTSSWPTYLLESSWLINSPCGSTSGRLTTTGFMAVAGA